MTNSNSKTLISYNPLFFNSLLLFSDKSMKILQNSKVAVAGIGGVGCIAVEMLARQGIGNIKVADIDIYSDINLNRQVFATTETLGQKKAEAAKDRILKINSDCNVEVFADGINKDNIYEFIKDVDVVLNQVDKESVKVLLHKAAKEKGIPVICGSRSSLEESRWCVTARLWDYKNNKELACYNTTNHSELEKYSINELTEKLMSEYDKKIAEKKKTIFKQHAKNHPELFKSISQKDLNERLESFDNYANRHVCAVLANIGGCFAATSCIRYLLGSPVQCLKQDLW